MPDMDDVRNELFNAAERMLHRKLNQAEKDALIEAYNALPNGTVFDKCARALEKVLHVDLKNRVLLEKSASVDQVLNALANLRAIAASSAKK